jgi:hypothetical protein
MNIKLIIRLNFYLFLYFKNVFLYYFDVLIQKIIFKNKKYYFNIFINKIYFKK